MKPIATVSLPDPQAWFRATLVTTNLSRELRPWNEAVHAVGNRIASLAIPSGHKPLNVLFYAEKATWSNSLAVVSGGVVADDVWIQPCRGPQVYAHVRLDTVSQDIAAATVAAYHKVLDSLTDDHKAHIWGSENVDTSRCVRETVEAVVKDPTLAGVFAGQQPRFLPDPPDWICREYVRIKVRRGSSAIAELSPVSDNPENVQDIGAIAGAQYRCEVNRDWFPHDQQPGAWISGKGHRLCLTGSCGYDLVERFNLPVVPVACAEGEQQTWVVDAPVVGVQWYDPVDLMLLSETLLWKQPEAGERAASAVDGTVPLHPNEFGVPSIGWMGQRPPVMSSPEIGWCWGWACRDLLVRRDVADVLVDASCGDIEVVELDTQDIEVW